MSTDRKPATCRPFDEHTDALPTSGLRPYRDPAVDGDRAQFALIPVLVERFVADADEPGVVDVGVQRELEQAEAAHGNLTL